MAQQDSSATQIVVRVGGLARQLAIAVLVSILMLPGLSIAGGQAVSTTEQGKGDAPNIVVIMTDDLSVDLMNALLDSGWAPNIQHFLVDEGVRFDNAFVTNSLCCPSRATYLTGQYSHTHKVRSNRLGCSMSGIEFPGWFPTATTPGRSESTVATWLNDAGYATGYVGRYLNGYGSAAPEHVSDPKLYVPPGWDDWQALVDPTTFLVYDYELNDNGTLVSYGDAEADYQTDVLARRAVEFINERAPSGTPLFLTVMPFAPHLEVFNPEELKPCGSEPPPSEPLTIRPAPRHLHLSDGDMQNGEAPAHQRKPSFNEADLSDKPRCGIDPVFGPHCAGNLGSLTTDRIEDIEQQYLAMGAAVMAVDDLVGSVVQALETQGILENTVLMFTSDNGWLYGEHRANTKILHYEESIRVPLYIRPAGGTAGAVASHVVLNNDLAPSIAELAGVVPPYEPDGRSLVPLLTDPGLTIWQRSRFLVAQYYAPPGDFASMLSVRQITPGHDVVYMTTFGDISSPGAVTGREFYNLVTDPYQEQSIVPANGVVQALENVLQALSSCAGAECRSLEDF